MIDEEVDKRMLKHESNMHKPKVPKVHKESIADISTILKSHDKSHESIEVNTPQKNNSKKDRKSFEIQTFGR